MQILKKVKELKKLDPLAVGLSVVGFGASIVAGIMTGDISFGSLAPLQIAATTASQVFGLAGMVASAQVRTLKTPREKMGGLIISGGLNAIQYALLLVGGVGNAIGGLTSMAIASARSAVYYKLTDPQTKTHKTSLMTRTAIAAGFIALGWGFLTTGFGLVTPKVPVAELMQFGKDAVVVSLPMLASMCGAAAGVCSRTRYMRPIFTAGGLFNIAYNCFSPGALSHLISETNACFLNIRQTMTQDVPPTNFKGQLLSRTQRLKMYWQLFKEPKLQEEHYPDMRKGYDYLAQEKPQKVVFLLEGEAEAEDAVVKPVGQSSQGLYAQLQNPKNKEPRNTKQMVEAIETVFKDAETYGFAKPITHHKEASPTRPARTAYILRANRL